MKGVRTVDTTPVAGIEHGGSGTSYVHHGCRCDACCQANSARVHRRKRERFAARVLIDGRLTAPGAREHGSLQTYGNWGCRCLPCMDANRRHSAAVRARRRANA